MYFCALSDNTETPILIRRRPMADRRAATGAAANPRAQGVRM